MTLFHYLSLEFCGGFSRYVHCTVCTYVFDRRRRLGVIPCKYVVVGSDMSTSQSTSLPIVEPCSCGLYLRKGNSVTFEIAKQGDSMNFYVSFTLK